MSDAFWAVFTIIILCFVTWWLYRWTRHTESQNPWAWQVGTQGINRQGSQFSGCQSPDCIRCQKYEFYLSHLDDRLETFAYQNGWEHLGRIAQAVRGIRSPSGKKQQPNVLYLPGLAAEPWWSGARDSLLQTELKTVEDNKGVILTEYMEAISAQSAVWNTNMTPNGQWNTLYLYNQGEKNVNNCSLCPKTTAMIEGFDNFMQGSIFGNALFSVLHPGTDITEHYGPCNVRLRCHLGLLVPQGCFLVVDGERHEWREGQCVIFDDSFNHSAHHQGQNNEPRVVLLIDLWHPDVKSHEIKALNFLFPTILRENKDFRG